jgi:hypothetical protein
MNAAPMPVKSGPRWYVRPGVVLPIVATIVLFTALLAPERIAGRTGDARLSTNSTEPQGARLFYELAQRLGWRAERRLTAELPSGPGNIYAVLGAPVPPRIGEVHALLEYVRHGGALFVVLSDGGDPIGDSLHVAVESRYFYAWPVAAESRGCEALEQSLVPLWPDNRAHMNALRWRGPRPGDGETFLRVGFGTEGAGGPASSPGVLRPAVVGFRYGNGRIVVASDPDFLRNDALRVCAYGLDVPAVRALEYLRDGGDVPRETIVFDEFHQGFGVQPGTMRTIATYLGGSPSGHLFFQLLGAGLVLLVSLAPRNISPQDPERIERRSPLEHVDALARAYGQVGATRTATARLVRGVRRRLEHGSIHARAEPSDEAFLQRVEQTVPGLAADVALLRRALAKPLPRREFEAAGTALQRLETSLTRV